MKSLQEYFYIILGLIVILLIYFAVSIVFPPWNFPKNIPTIPFYVSFLGAYTDLDQYQIYEIYLRDKLEKYGAAKIYFASRWNIIVTRPSYLLQVLKDDDTYAKKGNHIKIPYSVLSDYTGDNLISSNGDKWKLYRKILTKSIQFPDMKPIIENSSRFLQFIEENISSVDNSIHIGDAVQRYSLANLGGSLLGIDFKLFEDTTPEINSRLSFVKSQIFKPLYLNFPFLDMLPIPSRILARKAVSEFRQYFCNLIIESQRCPETDTSASYALVKALNDGTFQEKQFKDNAMIIMIAGHENPQLLLNSLIYMLAKFQHVQIELRDELTKSADVDKAVYLHSVIYETLRILPPLGQIINRCTTRNTILGDDIKIPKGTFVGYNNFATGRDKTVWQEADCFIPKRWGSSLEEVNRNYSKSKSSAALPAFHGRKRACLGEKFALYEMKQALAHLVLLYKIELDEEWTEKLTPGGPVAPLHLKVKLQKL